MLILVRDYDGALEQLRRARPRWSRRSTVWWDNWMSVAYEGKGMHEEAVEHDLVAIESELSSRTLT